MKFHLDKVQNLAGFAAENAKVGDTVKVLTRALLTSDDPNFYQYIEQISNIFIGTHRILIDEIYQFLVVIHQDSSADLYVNDFKVSVEIKAKRDMRAGEMVTQGDVADIRRVKFPDIDIKETDKVIYCFKVGWRFGLFFDLTPRARPAGVPHALDVEKLNTEAMMLSIGALRRYLSFYHVYKVLESDTQFEEMMKDGWFPFVEILAGEYKTLSEAYQDKFDFQNKIKTLVDSFTEERINKIVEKWWKNQVFAGKKPLIEAGINAYLQDSQDGFVNCIKNLWTEVEGILRKVYHAETGKGAKVQSTDLINHIVEKAKIKSGSDQSLLLPLPFLKYLKDVVFANFNVETGSIDLSRHSSSHGVAEAQQYTKDRALQLILILDQLYFYS